MDSSIIKNLPPEQRMEYLQENAQSAVKGKKYTKPIDTDRVNELHSTATELFYEIMDVEEEKKQAVKDYNDTLKDKKMQQREIMRALRTGTEEVEGDLYLLDDQEEGTMTTYDSEGNVISTRNLYKSERQLTIKSKLKVS